MTKPREVDEALVATLATEESRDVVRAILAALPHGGVVKVLDADEEFRLAKAFHDAQFPSAPGLGREEARLKGLTHGVRALLAAAGRYVAPAESKGPATGNQLLDVYEQQEWPQQGLRAVYDLGFKQGRLATHDEYLNSDMKFDRDYREHVMRTESLVPFVPDDALVEKMAKAHYSAKTWADMPYSKEAHRQYMQLALSALPPLFVAAGETCGISDEKDCIKVPIPEPERLPFVGLDAADVAALKKAYSPGNTYTDIEAALCIIARALGVSDV